MSNFAEASGALTPWNSGGAHQGWGDGHQAVTGTGREVAAALGALAYNLRWAWEPRVAELFRSLAPAAWERAHNPVDVLRALPPSEAASAATLTAHADAVLAARRDLEEYLTRPPRREVERAPVVAYFSAEFGVAECLTIYSGGLGVLAGDHLKAASDLGVPLVAVGLLYRYGYFRQTIDESHWQRERYDRVEPSDLPLHPVYAPDGSGTPLVVGVPFPGRTVHARVWRAQVGRVPLYLLDTELPENREDDRWITGHLYGGDQDTRIRQEIVLGVGGVRVLRAIGVAAHVFHMNEGHSAFLSLELARERLEAGSAASFDQAVQQVAPQVAFTTHTPVAAGHDAFPADLVEAYFAGYRERLGLSHEAFMGYGRRDPETARERFSMTVLALRTAHYRNGVSQLHGVVSRQMWGGVGVGRLEARPASEMDAITNGVHTSTWAGPEMWALFDREVGEAWRLAPDRPETWQPLVQVDDAALWAARTGQRARLLARVDEAARAQGAAGVVHGIEPERTLVLGFARRFATYKRAGLLLQDAERLARLLNDPARPVVLVFAGKAHPRDEPGKLLMQRVINATREERFLGRIMFLENYDLALGRLLTQGSDVWINTPRRPEEASGTSGMKATLNGGLHLSELDGWWAEAHRPEIGWALGAGISDELSGEARDAAEAVQLLDLIEWEVLPTFFARDGAGRPTEWLERVRQSVSTLGQAFSAHRMVLEYVDRVYEPASVGAGAPVR